MVLTRTVLYATVIIRCNAELRFRLTAIGEPRNRRLTRDDRFRQTECGLVGAAITYAISVVRLCKPALDNMRAAALVKLRKELLDG